MTSDPRPGSVPPRDLTGLHEVRDLVRRHDAWRARTLNLIASENVLSPAAREVLDSDLLHRYAEGHPGGRYYEGTRYVDEIESRASAACRRVFKCGWADVRPISGTVSNEAVFSRLVPRGATVIAHKVATGGHISHDRMGALGKRTDRILPWPTLPDGYTLDAAAARDLISKEQPALVVLGRSLFLFPEPVAQIREAASEAGTKIVFDGAHVLGLVAGGCFQDPLAEGADVLTGSTHKTFFGPQRGVVLATGRDEALRQAVDKGVFPGSTSNHHLFSLPSLARRDARDRGVRRRLRRGGRRQREGARAGAGRARGRGRVRATAATPRATRWRSTSARTAGAARSPRGSPPRTSSAT